jgi:quercetin dioxygenase-like cupin family protein
MVDRRFALAAVCVLFAAAPLFAGEKAAAPATPVALAMSDAGLQWGPCPDFAPKGCAIAVLHGNPAERNSDIFFRLPGGSEIATHRHTSAERMVLVSGELDVAYEGKPVITLKQGMYAFGPAQLAHSARCRSSEPCVLFIAFEEPLDAIPTAPAATAEATTMAAQ